MRDARLEGKNKSLRIVGARGRCVLCLLLLVGCSRTSDERTGPNKPNGSGHESAGASPRTATAKREDVDAATARLDAMKDDATYELLSGNVLTKIVIHDGSALTADDIGLFGKLTDLDSLQILNFRALNDEMASTLSRLTGLNTVALTNSVIGDATVAMLVRSLPNLKYLDLSSNTNITNRALKAISELSGLEHLILVQNRFNDLGTIHLSKLTNLKVLDLRGNMEAGDMTMEVVGSLPNLQAVKHRSTTVTDYGMESLGQSKSLRALLMQDFGVSGQTGQHLAKLGSLTQLEIFRCQGFGPEGVLALKSAKLERLTLRDLPLIDDRAMQVFTDLPRLRRLYLHELASVSDTGLQNLRHLASLELLDIWSVSQMSDATLDVIAGLPKLETLSIRTTGVSDAAVDKLLSMPSLRTLTFKENGMVSDTALQRLSAKKWDKLDIGSESSGP